jgi:hypothetical protein
MKELLKFLEEATDGSLQKVWAVIARRWQMELLSYLERAKQYEGPQTQYLPE